VSEKRDRWNIVQLELVSLLKHNPPMVYQSANLPRMDELKNNAVRLLTPFESKRLASLHSCESPTIYTNRNDKFVRMLGAIRTRSDCRDCHHVPEGTLLGAFSYELQEIDSSDYVPPETIANEIIETQGAPVLESSTRPCLNGSTTCPKTTALRKMVKPWHPFRGFLPPKLRRFSFPSGSLGTSKLQGFRSRQYWAAFC
jgi:hypothetical protein